MWSCHVDESSKIRHNLILVIDIIEYFCLDLIIPECVIIGDDLTYKGCTSTMVDFSA